MTRAGRHFRKLSALCLFLATLGAGVSHAALINFTANIDGAQANAGAGTGSLGTGFASATFDTDTNLFSWNVSWTGLSGPATLAHFHGPALPNQNAGVQVTIDHTSNPDVGSEVITAGQASDLLSELWYVNIHTEAFPAGEIRGQVLVAPEPGALLLVLGGSVLLVVFGRRRSG